MRNTEMFANELNLIKNNDLREFALNYLVYKTPSYFWDCGASSSGKYHPKFSQGQGGLIRHTKAVVKVANELLNLNQFGYITDIEKDYVIMACLFHDTAKYGYSDDMDKSAYKDHPQIAAQVVSDFWYDEFGFSCPYLLVNAIASHMGQWGSVKSMTSLDRCVHLADYFASRSFIDIPEISAEYNSFFEIDEEISYSDLAEDTKALYQEG